MGQRKVSERKWPKRRARASATRVQQEDGRQVGGKKRGAHGRTRSRREGGAGRVEEDRGGEQHSERDSVQGELCLTGRACGQSARRQGEHASGEHLEQHGQQALARGLRRRQGEHAAEKLPLCIARQPTGDQPPRPTAAAAAAAHDVGQKRADVCVGGDCLVARRSRPLHHRRRHGHAAEGGKRGGQHTREEGGGLVRCVCVQGV